MSTAEYLKQLNLDQLKFAKEEAARLIGEIKSQEKIKLWVVSGTVNKACYEEGQFEGAKKKLCELIMSDDFGPEFLRMDHPMINKQVVYESEVESWMELNT